jgi:hypothetical protein
MRRPILCLLAAVAMAMGTMGTTGGTAGATTLTPLTTATSTSGNALFGVYPAYNPGHVANAWSGANLYTDVPQMNRWQGRANAVINTFGPISDVNNMFLPGRYFTTIWNTHHAVPMYSVVLQDADDSTKPGSTDAPGDALDDYESGDWDSALKQTRDQLYTWINGTDSTGVAAPPGGRRVYFRLMIEPNTYALYADYSPAALSDDCTDLLAEEQQFVRVWRKIRNAIMKDDNGNDLFTANQVQWIFNVFNEDLPKPGLENCANGASDITANIYPGDDVVDWLGIDGLVTQIEGYPALGNQMPVDVFGPMVTKLRSIAPTKPIGFDEDGVSTTQSNNVVVKTPAWKDDWLQKYFAFMDTNDIRMSIWNNLNQVPADWAVFSLDNGEDNTESLTGWNGFQSRGTEKYTDPVTLTTYNAYTQYRLGVSSARFTAPDPTNPRVISDQAFRGM